MDFYISREGRQKLMEELRKLKAERRPQIAKALEEARAHGDLRENAEYDAAKQEQSLVETRIRELEDKLARAVLLEDAEITGEHVSIGCSVVVEDLETGEKESFALVGEEEADPKNGKISIRTPIAKGLIGKKIGEEAVIEVPAGRLRYKILSIGVGSEPVSNP